MRVDILGIGFDSLSLQDAVNTGCRLVEGSTTAYAVTPNSEIVYDALENPDYAGIINSADLVLPDGIGVIYASKILGTPIAQKVAGVDFAFGLLQAMAERGLGVYFFGSKPGVAETAAQKLKEKIPALLVSGCHDGYFDDDAPIIADINASGARCLFVCLGAPKQELWMNAHKDDLPGIGLMIGLGGSLDSFAGTVKRAPRIFIKLGLEWLYRLIKEPWRFKRMLRLPKFLWKVIKFKCSGGNKK